MYENQSGGIGCRYWDLNGKKGYYTQSEAPFIQLLISTPQKIVHLANK